ncbi:hypothetical protein FQR65_LT16023 [Abscondita terminalis]|nr:hypothetical protein FQR65_LT16023 [Abscondita terminalis]
MIVGVLGCMAERLKSKFLEEEKLVDVVVGPDAYRDLPNLIEQVDDGAKAVNVLLSREETYADINPRLHVAASEAEMLILFLRKAQDLFNAGYQRKGESPAELLIFLSFYAKVADVSRCLRVPVFDLHHPKDITDEVFQLWPDMKNHLPPIIHLPVTVRAWYIDRVDAIRRILPECGISTDVITGFCTETEEEHQETLSMMDYVKYDYAYMFAYSERPGTLAAKRYEDDIPRGNQKTSFDRSWKVHKILIEGIFKRSDQDFAGRNDKCNGRVSLYDNRLK